MKLCLFRLLVDFGLLVLIWMVQLIVYPSFTHFSKENLVEWHVKYTAAMGYIVGPLMLIQLGIYLMISIGEPTFFSIVGSILVLAIWVTTFFQFVPKHKLISEGKVNNALLNELVRTNWIRTTLWSLLFVVSCISCL
ncbi:hypothetical protein [Flagellimonas meridianipacifica]|uniref:DUF1772 domain-containing protein n=1 Tax=Flagellimonas meridianipacifica TaxID=1080225 RepID=A0A2T0MHX2_9FLAO|nr:hypothetical protein [Allomuricauda pacifica]PRX57171.1 hypothetical protein CLV81_1173 [Allomuricauda pacifica]